MGARGRSGYRPAMRGGKPRGRGGKRGGRPTPRFNDSRVQNNDELSDKEQAREEVAPEEAENIDDDDASEDEEEAEPRGRPYMDLMRQLTESAAPKAKRRKLDHQDSFRPAENLPVENPPSDQDAENDVDHVEEPEEDPNDVAAEDLFGDDDDLDTSDPFETHFAAPDEASVAKKIAAVGTDKWISKKIAARGSRTLFTIPDVPQSAEISPPAAMSGPDGLKLKQRLSQTMERKRSSFDAAERSLAPSLFQYHDILYYNRTVQSAESLRRMASLHAVNHVFKTRDRVIKNNAKLARESGNDELDLRDQGFTRPKVLMLLPTRQSCAKMVDMICSICEPDQQENRKRFDDSYIDKDSKFSQDRPADFRDLFDGNDDDMFRIGVKFTRKTIKYFAQFYNSDILMASPLGLRMAIGSEEDKKVDCDFLSSIEMVIVDQADAMLMQNWAHVEYIFEHLNLQPKDAHGCDFSRVRNWYLEDQAKYFRQTVIFSAFNTPELAELSRLNCKNWAGKVRTQPEYTGVIQQLGIKAKQTFSRFEASSAAKDAEARFAYFTSAIVPSLVRRAKDANGTLVFIPSWFDFVRVRNWFATSTTAESLTFGTISEYADVPEASRARSHFLTGRHRILLYTERAHHFRRYQLKGVRRVIMYGLPDNPIFYKEITGDFLSRSEQDLKLEPGQGSVRVMFSKYDVLKLERIAGTQRVGKMIHEKGDTFDFL